MGRHMPDPGSMFVPADLFVAGFGTPTTTKLSLGTQYVNTFTMIDGGSRSVGALLGPPFIAWESIDVAVVFANAGATSGDVVWRVDTLKVDGSYVASATAGTKAATTAGAQNVETVTAALVSGLAVDLSSRLSLGVVRLGADGLDTLAESALFTGVLISQGS